MTKKSAAKPTSKPSRKTAKSQPNKVPLAEITAPRGEPVTRYEMLGACDFVLVDPGEGLDTKAREALLDSSEGCVARCVIQCDGYVFNLTMLPAVTLIDKDGNATQPATHNATSGTNSDVSGKEYK